MSNGCRGHNCAESIIADASPHSGVKSCSAPPSSHPSPNSDRSVHAIGVVHEPAAWEARQDPNPPEESRLHPLLVALAHKLVRPTRARCRVERLSHLSDELTRYL